MRPGVAGGRQGRKWGMSVNNDLPVELSAIARHFLIPITVSPVVRVRHVIRC